MPDDVLSEFNKAPPLPRYSRTLVRKVHTPVFPVETPPGAGVFDIGDLRRVDRTIPGCRVGRRSDGHREIVRAGAMLIHHRRQFQVVRISPYTPLSLLPRKPRGAFQRSRCAQHILSSSTHLEPEARAVAPNSNSPRLVAQVGATSAMPGIPANRDLVIAGSPPRSIIGFGRSAVRVPNWSGTAASSTSFPRRKPRQRINAVAVFALTTRRPAPCARQ